MKTLPLTFEDFPDEILVQVSPVPSDALFDVIELVDGLTFDRISVKKLADALDPYVVKVNGKKPNLMALDFNLLIATTLAWVKGVRDVPLPLLQTSSAGEP